jgi:hypothetical protein
VSIYSPSARRSPSSQNYAGPFNRAQGGFATPATLLVGFKTHKPQNHGATTNHHHGNQYGDWTHQLCINPGPGQLPGCHGQNPIGMCTQVLGKSHGKDHQP